MNYTAWFHQWHAIAYQNRYKKRGTKYNRNYWVQRHPTDPDAFQMYQQIWLTHKTGDTYARVPPKARGQLVVVTARVNELIIDNQTTFKRITVDVPPEYKLEYSNAARESGPYRCADSTFNNMLRTIGPGFYHVGNRSTYKPGFNWFIGSRYPYSDPVGFVGPARYNPKTNTISPAEAQPDEIKREEERKHINASLRNAFKRLKVLMTLGVAVTDLEIAQAQIRLLTEDLYSPQNFVDFANKFDPQAQSETVELCARASSIARTYQNPRPLESKAGLENLRRALQRQLLKVTNPV